MYLRVLSNTSLGNMPKQHWCVSPYDRRYFPAEDRPFRKGSGNLRLAVKLPEGEDLNEWLAVHGKLSYFGLKFFSVDDGYHYYHPPKPSISSTTLTCSTAQ